VGQPTLANVLDFVDDFIPDLPQAKVVRKLNLILADIHELVGADHRGTFTTKAPVTTGTVSLTANSASVTFSSGVLLTTNPLAVVLFDGDSTWYTVTRNGADTAGTLSSVYAGATAATATYQMVFPLVTYPSTVGQVLRVWREGMPDLIYGADEATPGRSIAGDTGVPLYRSPYIFNSGASPDDSLREWLTPAPDDEYSFAYVAMTRATELAVAASTSTVLGVPGYFDRAVKFGTLALCWGQDDSEGRYAFWTDRYKMALRQAMGYEQAGAQTRMRSAWESRDSLSSAWQYPPPTT